MDIYFFRPLGHLLVSPLYHSGILLVILSAIYWYLSAYRRAIKPLMLIVLGWLLLCTQPFFYSTLLRPLENYAAVLKANDPAIKNTQALLVMACYAQRKIELPEVSGWHECSLQRLVQAVIIYRQHPVPIYVTGGFFIEDHEQSFAAQSKDLLISLGVPSKDIVALPEGGNTQEELKAALSLLTNNNVGVISAATHMHRIALLHEQLLPKHNKVLLSIPVDHILLQNTPYNLALPTYQGLENTRRALYEHLAILVIKL